MANPQNLRPPWPKGQTGNIQGHSKSRRAAGSVLRQIDTTTDPKSVRAISERWLALILAGNFQALKAYLDRRDGKITGNRKKIIGDLESSREPMSQKSEQ